MKAHAGVDGLIYIFLTSALVGDEWPASSPGLFIPGERSPCTHGVKGWIGPRTDLNDVERRQILPLQGPELQPPAIPLYRLRCPGSLYFAVL
jgi:hypothetical protein